jgi:hypothetical protein
MIGLPFGSGVCVWLIRLDLRLVFADMTDRNEEM